MQEKTYVVRYYWKKWNVEARKEVKASSQQEAWQKFQKAYSNIPYQDIWGIEEKKEEHNG